MEFDELYEKSNLENVLALAKTLVKEECGAVYEYMAKKRPTRMMEMGVQFGCSSRVFLEIAKWLSIDLKLDSFDIQDRDRSDCVDRREFNLHIENIEGRELEVIERLKPDVIYFDAHVYKMTRRMMEICVEKKIDFMAHDVSIALYESVRDRTNGFKDKDTYAPWELPVMEELLGKEVVDSDFIDRTDYSIKFVRSKWGVAILSHK